MLTEACVITRLVHPTSRSIGSRDRERARRAMRLVVRRTFLTLVTDESPDPPCSRSRSAPASLHHTDSHRPLEGDAAASPAAPKPRRKKPAKGSSTADAEDADVFEEYAAIVAEEVARLPPETPEQPPEGTTPRRGRRRRGDVTHGAMGHASVDEPQVRIHLNFHEPDDPRPANAIFVLREGYGEIGFDFDPTFSTTTLRSVLLGINNHSWDDGFVVACEGRFVPIGSTLGEQGIAPGAQLRLVRPSELNLCPQS